MSNVIMSLQYCYRRILSNFGDGGSWWSAGHGGTDYYGPRGGKVLAYSDGVIGYVGTTGWGGGVVGMKMDSGEYAGWAHLDPVTVSVGQRVKPGDTVGYIAGYGQNHGSQWDGPHIHTTRSAKSSIAAALGYRPLIDPAPGIAAAITPTIGTPGEADMKLIKVVQPTGTTWALLGLGFFQETRDEAQANAWAEVWGDSKQVSDLAWEQAYNAALLGQGMLSRATRK